MSAKAILSASVSVAPVYVEDVFSTFLYTGTGATQTITNGIDLSGKGGLTWIKGRSGATGHRFTDTARGATKSLASNSTAIEATESTGLTSFGSTGFTIGADADYNTSAATYCSWTFREQPKFFDVVTYTGNATNRTIAHNLGSVPGCIIVKDTSSVSNWYVYHRSLATNQALKLNSTDAIETAATLWNNTAATSSVFSLGTAGDVNGNTKSFVAYLFAHDAGGFGTAGTDNVVSCGSFTPNASGQATVNLGYEPQLILYKRAGSADNWYIYDTMRGWGQTTAMMLLPDLSQGEAQNASSPYFFYPTATGFESANSWFAASQLHVYIAIRRGPMNTPTVGTSVFEPAAYTGNGTNPRTIGTLQVTDLAINMNRPDIGDAPVWIDRLRGGERYLSSNATQTEASGFVGWKLEQAGQIINSIRNTSPTTYINWNFRRAPGFFDEVCGTAVSYIVSGTHNLGVTPELMIGKTRSTARPWYTRHFATMTSNQFVSLDTTDPVSSGVSLSATSTTFSFNGTLTTTDTAVIYFFATCAGVSKVGSYTGTGTTLQINCGFTAGARFVLIKRTDSTGAWYVWDTARGIISGNDPYLLLNSNAAEVTGTDYIDPLSSGFEISSTAPAAINANGGTYIFLAIA